jgi:uncharacterized protein YndB with AHSA1/START domain
MTEPLELEFAVACSPEHAFAVWAEKTSLWWPRGHSVSGHPEVTVVLQPWPGDRIYERTPDGVEHDWGEVLAWEPPRRLTYLQHVYGARDVATEVEITFTGRPGASTVSVVHRGWERLGALGPDLRKRNRRGWDALVPQYRQACVSPAAGEVEA